MTDAGAACERCGAPTAPGAVACERCPTGARAETPRVTWTGPADLRTTAAPADALALLAETFAACGVRRVQVDRAGWVVHGTLGIDMTSWGQSVEGRVAAAPEGAAVGVRSTPRFQVFDWGRGGRDARRIMEALAEALARTECAG